MAPPGVATLAPLGEPSDLPDELTVDELEEEPLGADTNDMGFATAAALHATLLVSAERSSRIQQGSARVAQHGEGFPSARRHQKTS